jgi:hypothetical protein
MIENGKVQHFGGPRQSLCRKAVCIARPRIAAWVVVRKDYAGAAKACCIDDDLPDGYADGIRLTIITFDMETLRAIVDMRHPKTLASAVISTEATGEELPSRFVSVEAGGGFGALKPHAGRLWK